MSSDLCLSYTVGRSVPRQVFAQPVSRWSWLTGLALDPSHHLGLVCEALAYRPNLVTTTAATPLTSLVYCRSAPSDGTAPACTIATLCSLAYHCCSLAGRPLACFKLHIIFDITAKLAEFWFSGWTLHTEWGGKSCCIALGIPIVQWKKKKINPQNTISWVLSGQPNAMAVVVKPFPTTPIKNWLVQPTLH